MYSIFPAIVLGMEAIYRLNTKELGNDFINSVRHAYPDQNVEILVREQMDFQSAGFSSDETEYLSSSPANCEHLTKAIRNIEEGKNIITFETIEQARQCAEEWASKQ